MNTKVVIGTILAFLMIPAIIALWPKPITVKRVQEALERKGFTVGNVQKMRKPRFEAIEETALTINGAWAYLYRYNNEGKIIKYLPRDKGGTGEQALRLMSLAGALNFGRQTAVPTSVGRRGMYILLITGLDETRREEVIRAFELL
ncbi:MAG: hypothetical protein HY706_22135 [Candidatus Hydrogenedentes bacterium]|nr:hypothetical protein [Candidatus Hydrogenedentota bacterium]